MSYRWLNYGFTAGLCLAFLPLYLANARSTEEARRAWEAQVGERMRDRPAFAFVEDDPALPRVLLIGDSISIGYTTTVREALAGVANVHRIPANGGDTARGRANLATWLGAGTWDVIHFNWGLHDVKRIRDGKLDVRAARAISPEDYEANLRALVDALKATGATLIWASTTPVPEGAAGRIPGDEVAYNAIAARVMTASDVAINDLHAAVAPELARWQRPANVHFLDGGSAHLGARVAEVIRDALQGR
jgi:acyl-CoA thioesterase-1